MTKVQHKIFQALKSLGAGWHTTTEVVRKLHPGKKSWKFNRTVWNTLFSLDIVELKWDPKTHATCYQWRIEE